MAATGEKAATGGSDIDEVSGEVMARGDRVRAGADSRSKRKEMMVFSMFVLFWCGFDIGGFRLV